MPVKKTQNSPEQPPGSERLQLRYHTVVEYIGAVNELPPKDKQLFNLVASCFTPLELVNTFVGDAQRKGWFSTEGLPDNCLVFDFLKTYQQ